MAPVGKHQQNSPQPKSASCDEVAQRARKLCAERKYQKALELLNAKANPDAASQNIKGVCLLRLGQYDEAVRIFRSLVLTPGCTWMRADVPLLHKVNFATALLLSGSVAGSAEVLGNLQQDPDPQVQRLRAVIQKWVADLTFFQKLNWWFGRIEPPNRPIRLDFEPGDLGCEGKEEISPTPGKGPPDLRAAA